jgi:mono/diheme cytochrome c family protein
MTKKLAILAAAGALLAPVFSFAADKVDFVKQVEPIFKESCYSCHGAEKQKGKLRLDSPDAFKKGGADGAILTPGDPAKSDLYRRITLPAGHDDIMPPKGDPLKKEQTELVAAWIKDGASFGDWKGSTGGGVSVASAGPKKIDLPQVAAADNGALEKVRGAGALAMPLAQGVNLLDVSFQSAADKTNDADLALLAPVAQQVYSLNLANSKVTDAGLAQLGGLTNLRKLHLEKTGITDAGLAHLKGLANLEYLNLYGTQVTDAGLANLEGLKNLRSLYVWQSKVTDGGVDKLKKAIPEARIDNGFKEPPPPTPVAVAAAPKPEDVKKAEDAKKAAEAAAAKKAEDDKKAAEAKKAEDVKKAEEAKKTDQDKKIDELRKALADALKKADDAKKAADDAAKKADEAQKAAEKAVKMADEPKK